MITNVIAVALAAALGLTCIPCGMFGQVAYGFLRQNWQTEKYSGSHSVIKEADLPFDGREETSYDLYYPADVGKTASLILYIHGGGFTGGGKDDGKSLCKMMASRGYVAATVEYTLTDETHHSDINMLCTEIEDCVLAIKQHCAEKGVTITDMAMSGASAGAILALLYGTRCAKTSAIPLKFIFEMSGPTTFDPVVWGCETPEQQLTFAQVLTGVPMSEEDYASGKMAECVRQISPAMLVDEAMVPILGAYGRNDHSAANKNEEFFSRLDQCGVWYQIIEFPNSGHALLNDPDCLDEYVRTAIELCEKYLST